MTKNFTKKVEDFVCEKCGSKVKGGGYTNHCPNCLWSRHVDIKPGDREAKCGNMMEPISIKQKNGEYFIIHKCVCGYVRKNKMQKGDNFEKIITLSCF